MATGKLALFKRGLVSLPRAQAGLVALCLKRVPLLHSCNVTAQSVFDGRLASDARLRGNSRLYGLFLGDLCAKGLLPKNGRQRLIFDTRETHHLFAQPPYTHLAGSQSLSSLHLPPHATLFRPRVMLSVFYQLRLPHWLGRLFGLPPIARKHLPRWLQSCANTSAGEVVEFHLWYRWAGIGPFGLCNRCWNISCQMKLARRLLRHLSPTPLWDGGPVVNLL